MGSSTAGHKTILCFGLVGLLHSAYSAAEWRGAARMMEGDPMLPLDIVLQTFIFLVVTMLGVIHIAGEFKEIRATVGECSVRVMVLPRERLIYWAFLIGLCPSQHS